MGRPVPRQLLRNELLDLTTIVPATAYHRRSYAERYSRSNRCNFFGLFQSTRTDLRRFLKKNFLIQAVDAGLITMSYLGN
jgi:hypothetical protein